MRGPFGSPVSLVILLVSLAILSPPPDAWAQSAERTVGLLSRDVRASDGYTLAKPFARGAGPDPAGLTYYLLNNAGNPVHQWTTPLETRIGGFMFLRENGELVFSGDDGFFALNPDGSVAWEIVLDVAHGMPEEVQRHHEIVEMPNGNMLIPAYILKTRTEAEAAGFPVTGTDSCRSFGRPVPPLDNAGTSLFVDNIWELAPTDPGCGFACGYEVVWRWNLWNHIVQDDDPNKPNYVDDLADHPGKVDIGYVDPAGGTCSQYVQGMWNFGRYNALDYNAERDEILMSASLFNEIQVIDHGNEQSDLLYRWGNPYAYGAGAPFVSPGDRGDQELSFQHRAHWIAPGLPGGGHVLIFNNGQDWRQSSVIEVRLPAAGATYPWPEDGEAFDPIELVWEYDGAGVPFFAPFVSSAQRLPNGNTFINQGPAGYLFEVTPGGEKVWEYVYPRAGYPEPPPTAEQGSSASLMAYRAWRYPPDYPGLAHLDLVPEDPLERYPVFRDLDIKPGSCQNPVNRKSNGVLSVAVLGSSALDAWSIDPASLLLEGFPASRWSIEDVAQPGECKGGDGLPDLVLKWDSALVKAAVGGLLKGEFEARLTGHSFDGWFLARDVVTLKK
jgi:hypothetical protein